MCKKLQWPDYCSDFSLDLSLCKFQGSSYLTDLIRRRTSTNASSGKDSCSLFKHPPSSGRVDTTIFTLDGNSNGSHSKLRPLSSSVSWSSESRNKTSGWFFAASCRSSRNCLQRVLKSLATSLGSLPYIRLIWMHNDRRRGRAAVESMLVPRKR